MTHTHNYDNPCLAHLDSTPPKPPSHVLSVIPHALPPAALSTLLFVTNLAKPPSMVWSGFWKPSRDRNYNPYRLCKASIHGLDSGSHPETGATTSMYIYIYICVCLSYDIVAVLKSLACRPPSKYLILEGAGATMKKEMQLEDSSCKVQLHTSTSCKVQLPLQAPTCQVQLQHLQAAKCSSSNWGWKSNHIQIAILMPHNAFDTHSWTKRALHMHFWGLEEEPS